MNNKVAIRHYRLNTEDDKLCRLVKVLIKCMMASSGNYVWKDMLASDDRPYLMSYDDCIGVERGGSGTSPTLTDR